MTLVIPPGYGQLAYRFALDTDPEVMVTTIGVDVDFGASGPQDKVNQKANDFVAAFQPAFMGTGWTFLGCVLRTGGAGGMGATFEAPKAVGGTAGRITVPNNCAFLVRKITAGVGRRARGRMYLPPFTLNEADVLQNGQLSTASISTLQGLVSQAFLGDDFVLLHDSEPVPMDPTVITGFVLDPKIATQRRRMRR